MKGFLTGSLTELPAFWAFAVVWTGAFTAFMAYSLVRLRFLLRRDRRTIARFFEAGAARPVLAMYHLEGERAAAQAGILLLSPGHRPTRGRPGTERTAQPASHPLLAALHTAVQDAGGNGSIEEVRASPRYPAFSARLRQAARRDLPGRRTRDAPGVREARAAVAGLFAVLGYGIGFHVRQPDAGGFWFLIALAVHVPAAVWLAIADTRAGGRDQWPEFEALCERCVAEARVRVQEPGRAARTDTAPAGGRADGGVGASGSCGGGCGGCGGGI
ncbi:hypothetical protein [Streptomyces yaizuensis]|uniref:TIGR04222 domain-containing membrane protein n=1 Tax=Streptomyces yaizuensis TaxID=2989713 RepID=A0ABQ5NXM0_9ACTN|nr:hypothetical protein [Streptomyces sp. YSPA8]GLF95104.1 hypothetical protein SYYSPA8_12425 [Streptomyces sp. YSPA8]